jgi:hypothetical protein
LVIYCAVATRNFINIAKLMPAGPTIVDLIFFKSLTEGEPNIVGDVASFPSKIVCDQIVAKLFSGFF